MLENWDQKANSPIGVLKTKSGQNQQSTEERMKLAFGSKSILKTEDPKHTLNINKCSRVTGTSATYDLTSCAFARHLSIYLSILAL